MDATERPALAGARRTDVEAFSAAASTVARHPDLADAAPPDISAPFADLETQIGATGG